MIQFIPPSPHVHITVLYICVSVLALQIGFSEPFFKTPHICINRWYLFFSDLLHSVWQSLGPAMSLQMTWMSGTGGRVGGGPRGRAYVYPYS